MKVLDRLQRESSRLTIGRTADEMPLTVEQIGCAVAGIGHLLNLFEQDVGMQVDDQHTHLGAIRRRYRRGDPNDRALWLLDLAELDVEVEG